MVLGQCLQGLTQSGAWGHGNWPIAWGLRGNHEGVGYGSLSGAWVAWDPRTVGVALSLEWVEDLSLGSQSGAMRACLELGGLGVKDYCTIAGLALGLARIWTWGNLPGEVSLALVQLSVVVCAHFILSLLQENLSLCTGPRRGVMGKTWNCLSYLLQFIFYLCFFQVL